MSLITATPHRITQCYAAGPSSVSNGIEAEEILTRLGSKYENRLLSLSRSGRDARCTTLSLILIHLAVSPEDPRFFDAPNYPVLLSLAIFYIFYFLFYFLDHATHTLT